ncbi:MAG: hypothetical protein RPU39_00255 [Candidatus Sedimenticola sp. (ex Thyasira tokunagai)]
MHNWIQETVASAPGVGDISLGGAYSAKYLPFSVRVADGEVIRCSILDGNNREVGIYQYNSAGNTLTRMRIIETWVNGTLDVSAPSPVDLTAAAVVGVAATQNSTFPTVPDPAPSGTHVYDAFAHKSNTNVTLVVDRLYVMPLLLLDTYRFDNAALRQIATAAGIGSRGRLGIYGVGHDGKPGLLLAESASDIDMTSTGYSKKGGAFPVPIDVGVGMYFVALITDSNAVVSGQSANEYFNPLMTSVGSAIYRARYYGYDRPSGWVSLPASLAGVSPDSTTNYAQMPRMAGVVA